MLLNITIIIIAIKMYYRNVYIHNVHNISIKKDIFVVNIITTNLL